MAVFFFDSFSTAVINGTTVIVPVTDHVAPKVKHLESGVFYDCLLTGVRYYVVDKPDGHYVFFDGITEVPMVLGSEANGGQWRGDGTLPYLKRDTDANFLAEDKRIKSLGNATEGTDALNQNTGDARYPAIADYNALEAGLSNYLQKAGGTMTGALNVIAPASNDNPMRKVDIVDKYLKLNNGATSQSIISPVVFTHTAPPQIVEDPTELLHAVNVRYLNERLSTIGSASGFQQSENIRRVIPSGVEETNRVYRTLEGAKIAAEFDANINEIIDIVIEGNGIDLDVATNYNLLPSTPSATLARYVNYVGINRDILMRVDGGVNYQGNSTDRTIFKNLIIDNEDEEESTTFTNCIFDSCTFKNLFGLGTYQLNNCRLIGDCIAGADVTINFNSFSTGAYFNPTTQYINTINAGLRIANSFDFEIINASGDVWARRLLGRRHTTSSITAATAISITDGNFGLVGGNTAISFISTTGWKAGSIIFLEFSGTPQLTHNQSPGANQGAIMTQTGANVTVTANQIRAFFLNRTEDKWYETKFIV
jgi:hypothetical protein